MDRPQARGAIRDAPPASERLKRRTRAAHERTEAAVEARFFAGGSGPGGDEAAIVRAGFRRLLEAFWGSTRPLDRRLGEAVARHLPDWEHAPRSERIRRDLATLGLPAAEIARLPTAPADAFPTLDGPAPLLGCLYVVEGSELGTRLIRRRLEAALAGTPDAPALEAELERARRYGGSFAVAMLDLDHFKAVNDDHGHRTGDRVLERYAELLEEELRAPDTAGRYGGEEFVLLLPRTTEGEAVRLVERLRERARELVFEADGETFSVTCSVGVTEFREEDEAVEAILDRADEALYRAKEAGRDAVKTG